MIRDIFENDLGFMEGTFFSELLGYDITVWYEKDIPLAYIEKISNILIIWIQKLC